MLVTLDVIWTTTMWQIKPSGFQLHSNLSEPRLIESYWISFDSFWKCIARESKIRIHII